MDKKNDTEQFFYDDDSFNESAKFTSAQLVFIGAIFPTVLFFIALAYILFGNECGVF
jgi:hypothetical protein